MTDNKRTDLEKEVDEELRNIKPEDIDKHFDTENVIHVPAKRGRKKKVENKQFYCSTCREWILEEKADKRPMGFLREEDGTISTRANRFSIFCNNCSKFLSIQDPETDSKIKDAINKVGNK